MSIAVSRTESAIGGRSDAFGRRMVDATQQGPRHFAHGKDKIGNAGFHGTLGHAVELGGFRTLHEDQPTRVVDGANSSRTVASRARQHDSDRPLSYVLGQGAEEMVDGERQGLARVLVGQEQFAAGDDHLLLGRNEIDGVRLHGHTVLDAADGDGRPPCQQFVHEAAEVRREVLNDDEGQPRLGGHLVEELFQGLKPAGRGSNAYHISWLVQHTELPLHSR